MYQPQGKLTFFCPHCAQKLSFLDGTVIKLVGRLHAESFSCKTMFYIPAKLGQYGAIVGEGVRIRDGARVEFECSNGACKHDLTSARDESLAEVRMRDAAGHQFVVLFNKVYGRRSTFLIDVELKELVGSYGEHAVDYAAGFDKPRNFFGS